METVRKGNWKWHIEDPELLEPWFADFRSCVKKGLIKSNSERDVFRVETLSGKKCIVKYSRPSSLLQKARSALLPKLATEFESAELLKQKGVPSVPVLGWGSSGGDSMLITEEVVPSENLRYFWFAEAVKNQSLKAEVLAKFAGFLRLFLRAGVYHPDFHPGNILISTDSMNLLLVDPYGVGELSGGDDRKIFEMLTVIGAFRGELTDDEGVAFIREVSPPLSATPEELWRRILEHEAEKSERLWRKRRDRLISDLRISQIFDTPAGKLRVLKDMAGILIGEPENFTVGDVSAKFQIEEVPSDEAEMKFLEDCRFRIHRLPCRRLAAWLATSSGRDILFHEKELVVVLPDETAEKRYRTARKYFKAY